MTTTRRETAQQLLQRTGCSIWFIDGQYYPVLNVGDDTVTDIGGRDAPRQKEASHWFARRSIPGVRYVASGSPTRSAALARIRRAFPVTSSLDDGSRSMEANSSIRGGARHV